MKNIFSNKYFILLSRLILGVVFIIASIDKISIPDIFALNVQAYKLLPVFLVNLAALIIPWVELICGIFLIGGYYVRSSSLLLSGLCLIFIIALTAALSRGLKIDCGCFGPEHNSPVSWMRIIEDICLLVLSAHIFFYTNTLAINEGEMTV